MKQLFFIAFSCICMVSMVSAQDTKIKSKDAAGKEVKVKRESDKLKVKGEGAGDVSVSEHTAMDMDQVKQQITANNQIFNQAFVKGDSAAMVELYHSEAVIYPPNMAMMNQRNEMGRMVVGNPAMGIKNMELKTVDVFGSGDLMVETGTYQMGDDTKVMDKGKYMVVWKQEDGKWKIYRDIWNSDMTMAPAKQ